MNSRKTTKSYSLAREREDGGESTTSQIWILRRSLDWRAAIWLGARRVLWSRRTATWCHWPRIGTGRRRFLHASSTAEGSRLKKFPLSTWKPASVPTCFSTLVSQVQRLAPFTQGAHSRLLPAQTRCVRLR